MSERPVARLRLYLLRHGIAEGMEEGRLFGHRDVALSGVGLEQARLLAGELASVRLQAIYSSDLSRASETAQIVAQTQGLEVRQDAAWREIDVGKWEGCLVSELYDSDPRKVSALFDDPASFQYPEGESFRLFTDRIKDQLNVLLRTHNEGDIALVTHAGVIRTIVGTLLEMPMTTWLRIAQRYGCLNIIDWHDDLPSLQLLNGIPAGDHVR